MRDEINAPGAVPAASEGTRHTAATRFQSNESPVNTLLDRLQKVRKTGHSQWQACCPAHDDNNPSLAVREVDDGRVLIHCWALCPAAEIVQSVGLELKDLFPVEHDHLRPIPKYRRWDWKGLLRQLRFESTVCIVGANGARDNILTDDDRDRLNTAAIRIARIVELVE